jgi:hypothetical protein
VNTLSNNDLIICTLAGLIGLILVVSVAAHVLIKAWRRRAPQAPKARTNRGGASRS